MMKEGGQNSFRFSLSWPRIILDKEGTVNRKDFSSIMILLMNVSDRELSLL